MSTPEDRIIAAVDRLEVDTAHVRRFRSGLASEEVPTEGGPVPTLAALVAEARQKIDEMEPIPGPPGESFKPTPPIIFEDTLLVLSAEHSARMVWTTSDEPVFVYFPNDLEGPFEGALVQGGEGQVTFLTFEGDELVAEGGLTGTTGRGAPVSYKFIQPGLWWLGGQRAEGQTPAGKALLMGAYRAHCLPCQADPGSCSPSMIHVCEAAYGILIDPDATPQEIEGATEAILAQRPAEDKSGLTDALQAAGALDEAGYTPESWQPVADAVAAGEALQDDPFATQSEVDAAAQAITDAIAALVPVAAGCSVVLTHDILSVEPAYMPAVIDGQAFSVTSPTTTGDYAASTALADLKPLPPSGIMWAAFRKDDDGQCALQIADAATLTTITFVPQGGDEWRAFYLGTATTVQFDYSGQAVMVGIGSDGAVYVMLDDASVVSVADMAPLSGTMPEFPLAGATGLAFVGVVRGSNDITGTASAEFITRAEELPQLPGGEGYDWCGNALPPKYDRDDLQQLLDDAAVLSEGDYTPDSWADLQAAVAASQAVMDDPDATPEAVNVAASDLDAAIRALEPAGPPADLTYMALLDDWDEVEFVDNPGSPGVARPSVDWLNGFTPTPPDFSAIDPPAEPMSAAQLAQFVADAEASIVDTMPDGTRFGYEVRDGSTVTSMWEVEWKTGLLFEVLSETGEAVFDNLSDALAAMTADGALVVHFRRMVVVQIDPPNPNIQEGFRTSSVGFTVYAGSEGSDRKVFLTIPILFLVPVQ